MIIKQILGNKSNMDLTNLEIDYLELEWFETSKRIQSRTTVNGIPVSIKFLREGQYLSQGDILFRDDKKAIMINIRECEVIVVNPTSLLEMGTVCYEIGNKHAPLFIQNNQILIPFEEPLFKWLTASGYHPLKETRQLNNMLRSTQASHSHSHQHRNDYKQPIFNKIINLASKYSNEK
ncbi:MAG: urease accessory protein UreE [Nitrosomonadaceae bacterium]|nr:urease accessory protein UreE [Nitrosomonadaceae bacterium]|tara:strand:+ start:401 stop:934 length:534 start_codon:yes stop_codon:yes gene_type:complete